MKKQVLVLISSLLFLAISLSSYSQSNSGGKVSAKDAKTIKAMDKALAKGDFVSYTKLKAGIFGYINCLSPSYSGCDSPVELITNAGDVEGQAGVSSIVWKAYDYTLGPGNEVLLPAGVITNNPVLKKWYFNPDMVPTYMNGKYIYFTVLVKKGPLEATTEDWAVFYQKPLQFDFVSPTLSLCQNDSVDIILNVNLDDKYTTYNLYKDGIATGKSVVGNGLPIAFKVGESGNYTVVGEIVYDPMLAPLPFPAPCTTVMNGSITVTVNPLPIINVTNDAPFCSGTQPLHLYCDNAAVTYSWSSFPNTSFTSTLQNPIINPGTTSDNGFYYLHVVDSKGCENFDTTQVNINPLPIIQLNSLTSTPCVNNAAGDEYSTDAGMDNYVWTFPGSTEGVGNDYIIVSGSGTNKIYINWLTPRPKTVAVIYNTPAPAGCTLPSPKTITVTVNPLPTITKTNTDKESCKDFSDTYSTEAGMSGYNWVITSGTGTIQAGTENTANAVITWTGGASGQVTVTYTNASGCSSTSAPYNVTINPLPTATASNNGPACEGGNVTLTGGANGLTTYAWSGPNSFISSTQSPVLSAVTVADAGTYIITVTDNKGCVNTNSTNVVVNAQPDATFTPDIAGAVCQGTTVKYTTQGAPNNSWDWTIVGGTIAAGGDGFNTVDVTWNNAAAPTKSVTVNYKNSPAGCMDLTPQLTNIVVNPLPTPTVLTGPSTPCIGSTGNIYTTQSGFSGYLWSIPVGSGTITSGQGTSSVTIDWLTQGSHNITVQYQGATVPACTATSPPYVVDVKPLPVAPTVSASPNPVCSGSIVTLTGSPATYAGYSWSGPDVITNSSAAVATVNNATTSGIYTLTVSDNFACQSSSTVNLVVTPLPNVSISGVANPCMNNSSPGDEYFTDPGNSSYTWTFPGSTLGVDYSIVSGAGTDKIYVNWKTSGTKTIAVNYVKSLCSAASPTQMTVTVNPIPVPTLITPATVCANSPGTYTTDAGMQAGSYLWSVVGGTISGPNNLSTVNVDWGVVNPAASLSVHYVNPAGCASSTKLNNLAITGLPTPTISLPVSNEACVGTPITYRTQVGMSGYVWTVSAGGTPLTSLTDNDSLTVVWNNPGATESVTVNYSNGCMGASPGSKTVNVNPKPVITLNSLGGALCEGEPNVEYWTEAGMSAYDWQIVGGTITTPAALLSTSDKIEVTWNAGAVHTLSVNYSLPGTGCRLPNPFVQSYTVNAAPTPTLTDWDNIECVRIGAEPLRTYTTQTGGGISGYTWGILGVNSGGIASVLGTNQINVNWSAATPVGVPDTVLVNYTNAAGCTSIIPGKYPVTVEARPTPSLINSPKATDCIGNTVTYYTQTGMSSYDWNVSAGGSILSGENSDQCVIKWNSTGAQMVSVTYSTTLGSCPATAYFDFGVTINALPSTPINGPAAVCTGSTNQYSAPAGSKNWNWVITNGSVVSINTTSNTVDVKWPASIGAGKVELTYDDVITGCTAKVTTDVVIGTQSIPSISGDNSVCVGSRVTYRTEAGMNANSYVWTVNGGTEFAPSPVDVDSIVVDWNLVGDIGVNNVSVTYTNPSGCPVVTPAPIYGVNVSALPSTETINSNKAVVCQFDTVTYSIPGGYNDYAWTVVNGTPIGVVNSNTLKVHWTTAGAGSVSVYYENSGDCAPTVSPILNLTVNGLPNPSLTSADTDVCFGSTGTYTTDVAPSGGYIWKVNNGTIQSGANSNQITVKWDVNALTHSVEVNYPNANGCFAVDNTELTVNVKNLPTPTIAGNATACINTSGQNYTTSSSVGVSNWVWTITGGVIDSGQGTSSVSVTWNNTVSPSISVSYEENGCVGTSVPYNVTVNNLPLTQTALTSPVNGEYCAGGAGVDILLASSEPTVTYQLFDAADVLIGTVPAGTSPVVWTGIPAGTYYVTGVGALPSSCSRVVASGIVVKANPLPTVYSIDPSNSVVGCNGGAGYVVGLLDSDPGVTYQLLLNSGAVGTAVPGTGSAITFGAQSSFGTYTVLATNDLTGCNLVMSNSFVMNPDVATTTYNLIANPPSGAYCDLPSGGVDISLSGSDVGVNYILKMGGNDIETVAGTGALINFARVKSAGTYSISVATLTGCGAPMTGNVKVQPVTPPLQYNVEASNAGFFCSGDAGASLQISGQQAGMVYQLFQFGNPLPIDTQTGLVDNPTLPLLFSGLYSDGTYSVLANHPLVAGCFVAMNNNVTVTANPLPVSYVVTSDGDFCVGGSTNINLSNSDISAQYRVVNVDDNSTSTWTLGTGSPLSFSVSNSGNYTVEASNIANGITCTNWMQDTVTVTAQNLPSDVSVVTSGGTGCNDGVVITILSSQAGVSYSVVDQVLGTTQGAPVIGNGLDISFPPIVDSGKIYDIHANSNGCDRIVGSPITVNISGVITKQLVTGGGTICSGNSATIGLGDTEVGVQYNLYLADAPGGTSSLPAIASLVGDGLNKTFGATISTNGEYYVEGSSGGCINEMANRVVVSLNPTINAQIIVSPNDTVCANSAVLFTGRGGDRYTFYLNNSSLGMAADSTLNLASVLDGAQIKVFVENSVTGCSGMSLPITMSVDDQLSSFTLQSVSGGLICPSTTDSLYLSGSEWGVDYVLYNQTDSPIDTISGNNGVVYFANISTGSYYVIASRAGGSPCGVQAMNDTVSVTISPVPTIYDLSPNGVENGCLGGNIDLNGSDLGVSYHLVRNGVNVVASIPGTGIAISFVKPLVAGLYTIQAIYGNGCSVNMNGSLDIVNPPTENIYTLSANPLDGRYCNNGSNPGVALTLSNSDATKTYSLYRDGTSIKDTISVGGAINFGSHTTAGFYSVLIASNNGCFDQMDSVIHIVPVAPPTAFALQVDNGGSYCVSGGTGVGIQLVGQQDDVVYELYLGGVKVGEAVGIDNNSATDLPFMNTSNGTYLFTTAGTYSVVAHYVMPVGCDVNMINSVNVVPTADPTNFIVSTAGDFCEGGSTIINVNGSETAVDYRWINITTTDAGAWTVGTGGLLQFSGINLSGDYIVEARSNLGASCTVTLLDTVTVVEVKMPHARNYTVENGGTCSDASLIIVENAEPGVVYTLIDAITNVPTSISFVGNTNLLDTMQIIDSNGKYFIQAARMNCSINFPGAPFIDINNADPATVKKHVVTPVDASICNGELGVKFGLLTNTAGIRYTLYWSLDNSKDAIPQDTIDSFIGNGLANQQFSKLGKKRGTYYVLGESATCKNYMTNDPELVVNPLPTAFKVTGSGMYCDPDPNPLIGGAQIGVEHQEDRVLYTLQQYDTNDDYVNDVAEFRGSLSGLPFVFGSYKESGINNIYRVVAIDTITGCTSNMNGRVEVQFMTTPPDLPVVNLGISNGRYCQGTNGAPIVIDTPQVGLTYQVFLEKLPVDTIVMQKVALTTDPLTLGYVEVGKYHVNASWGGDACIQSSSSFDITQRIPIAFNVDYDCGVTDSSAISSVLNAGRISLDSSEIGITYLVYDSGLNLVGFNNGIDAPLTFTGLYGAGKYSVQGTCSASATPLPMANDITITFPADTFDLTIRSRSSLTGVRGDTILIDGFETNATYYSRIETWVDTFSIGALAVTPPLEFPTDSAGMYHILAINDHNCGAIINKTATILETMLVANNDTLRFGKSDLIGSIAVGLNDYLDRGRVDIEGDPAINPKANIVYRLVHGGLNPDISLDSVSGLFTYVKSPTFFGKDSIRYAVINKDVPNRADTALVWIFVGNKDIGSRTFLIPNAFSPNGDGINDYFVITTIYAYSTEESELEIYNRWGSLVYRSKDKSYDNKWDGHANANLISIGDVLPNGTYFYIYKVTFNVNGVLNKEEYNGFIELRR